MVYDPDIGLLVKRKNITAIGLGVLQLLYLHDEIYSADFDVRDKPGSLRDLLREPELQSLEEGSLQPSIFSSDIRENDCSH